MSLQIVQFTNYDVSDVLELLPEDSVCGKRKPVDYNPEKHRAERYQQKREIGLDLQNCNLNTVEHIKELAASALFFPELLIFLDLRCNKLTNLRGVEELRSLKILYAHGNLLETVEELQLLKQLSLDALTVHGNPLVRQTNYKYWIILAFPGLKRLDFSGITRVDRAEAEQAQRMKQITLKVDTRIVFK